MQFMLAVLTGCVLLLSLTPITWSSDGMTHGKANGRPSWNYNRREEAQQVSTTPRPQFVATETLVSVGVSQMATLRCVIRFLGDRQVVWRRVQKDEFLTVGTLVWSKDPRILVEHRNEDGGVTHWDLLLRNVQLGDAGTYECQMTSSDKMAHLVELRVQDPAADKAKSRVHKQVTLAPDLLDQRTSQDALRNTAKHKSQTGDRTPDRQLFVTAGNPVRLSCNSSRVNHSLPRLPETDRLTGDDQRQTEWYKDEQKIGNNFRVKVIREQSTSDQVTLSELIFNQPQLADSGDYFCRLKNIDLAWVRLYVLPNTTIGIKGDDQDTQSMYFRGHTQPKASAASSSSSSYWLPWGWCMGFLCLVNTLRTVDQLAAVDYRCGLLRPRKPPTIRVGYLNMKVDGTRSV